MSIPDALLVTARAGDEGAYRRLVEPHRRELQAHCYRMLGSLHDSEDALQDALLRAWRGLPGFEGRGALRPWLYKIATNSCLDAIAKRQKRVLPLDHGPPTDAAPGEPLVESVWIEPYPDEELSLDEGYATLEARYELRESVELAFVAALQHLPANQRAALILREVLGFSAQEVADTLDTSVASVNSALQRARKAIDERRPDQSQQATLRELVDRYMDAMQRGDVEAVVALLAQDAAWSMPPMSTWYRGHDALRVFLANGPLSGQWQWRRMPTFVNGQAAVGAYTWWEEEQIYLPFALDVLTVSGEQIQEVTSFIARSGEGLSPDELARFPTQPPDQAKVEAIFVRSGLPSRLD